MPIIDRYSLLLHFCQFLLSRNSFLHHFCSRQKYLSSSSPCSLAGWGPSHLIASSTFIVNVPYFPLSSVVVFHSWPFVPALSRSHLTQSFHHSFGLPLLLLPPSSAFHALFDSLSSPILCTCPAHLILLPATFIFRCFFHANLFSQFLHLPSIFLGYFAYSSDPVVFYNLHLLLLSLCQCQCFQALALTETGGEDAQKKTNSA